jgi:pteridine reductase
MQPTSIDLSGQSILITGAARRIGRSLALAAAAAGARVILHHGHSPSEAAQTSAEIRAQGAECLVLEADLGDMAQAQELVARASAEGPLHALVNNAAIFERLDLFDTSLEAWQRHLDINLTAPFVLSQAFARSLAPEASGRILNILDWRALRPGADHLPYTVSKAALAALTRALAVALAPRIAVNGLALGAILPPSDGTAGAEALKAVPAGRWASLSEVNQAALFLLGGSGYVTGEILHVDGGRHLI